MIYLQIGNVSIPGIFLASFVAFFLASLLNRMVTRKKVGDWYSNAFFLFILIWKLSYIIFNLKLFLDMPFSLVYFNGGTKGHLLALIIISIYLLKRAPKSFPSIHKEASSILFLFMICYVGIIRLIEKQYIESIAHLVILLSFLFLLHSLKKNETFLSTNILILFLLLELFLLSLYQTMLSLEGLTFLWIGLTSVLILQLKITKEDRSLE